MPAVTNGSATATKPASKRFELPALNFKFSSLTDGTDIPPPLPSPTEEEKPVRKTAAPRPVATSTAGADKSSKTNGALPSTSSTNDATSPSRSLVRAGFNHTADDVPLSPTLSSRPGSIRRLFSRNLLNTAYTNGEEGNAGLDASGSIPRPDSRSDVSTLDDRKSRRSSGWFRRLRGAENYAATPVGGAGGPHGNSSPLSKRSSVVLEEPPKKPAGPPAPMIPELGELQAKIGLDDGSSLGNDLFKNIK